MSILDDIHAAGQSIWYDFISRSFVREGEMARLVGAGIRGMTSNPTIFEQAIAGGDTYDEQIAALDADGADTGTIATELFITDVQAACDVIRPVYEASNGDDGYISLEVSPHLAADTDGTIAEAARLAGAVDRPNLMIKIPATPEGLPAIRRTIADGISVNVTLIFSRIQYHEVAGAYLAGLEDRRAAGGDIGSVRSVASVFISRIDSMIDARLDEIGTDEAAELKGRAGLANARQIYRDFEEIFGSERFASLEADKAARQRPLWASTSTKDPSYPDLLYVDNLIGPHTVNTVPPATLTAILDHGSSERTLGLFGVEDGVFFEKLAAVGVDLDRIMERLLDEGVAKFAASFDSLFAEIDAKRGRTET